MKKWGWGIKIIISGALSPPTFNLLPPPLRVCCLRMMFAAWLFAASATTALLWAFVILIYHSYWQYGNQCCIHIFNVASNLGKPWGVQPEMMSKWKMNYEEKKWSFELLSRNWCEKNVLLGDGLAGERLSWGYQILCSWWSRTQQGLGVKLLTHETSVPSALYVYSNSKASQLATWDGHYRRILWQ